MRHFGLMANLCGYMAGGKEWVLDSGCTDHMTGDKDMFRELAENDGHVAAKISHKTKVSHRIVKIIVTIIILIIVSMFNIIL